MAITTRDAIRIAQIIARAPEQRLTMIMSALELADITLEGLEEIEDFRRTRNSADLVDVKDLLQKLDDALSASSTATLKEEGEKRWYEHRLTAREFSELCIRAGVNPKGSRRLLAEKGFLQLDSAGKSSITTKGADGKTIRITVLRIPERLLMEHNLSKDCAGKENIL